MSSMYPQPVSNLLSLITLTARGYTFTGTGCTLAFSKGHQVLCQATVSGRRIGQLLGRTLPALHAPQTTYAADVAPLTLALARAPQSQGTGCS
jgi:hypothetical protein